MLHSQALRDTLRQVGPDGPAAFSEAFATATEATVEPWYRATQSFDRHRLAEMTAFAESTVYDPGDPDYEMSGALALAAQRDPDAFRAFIDVIGVLELPEVVLTRPGLFEKVIELGAAWRAEPAFGPDRATLVALANA
jgi:hypothetical protein